MRLKVPSAAVSLLMVLPNLANALGLGDIQLKSPLNAPLNAEIELIGATAEELNGLRVQMASRELFSRYGLEYPAFLSSVQLRATRSADGRDVIQLTSATPMTEPFATLLIEANVARQRIVREYTVLFDPPVFAPAATAAPQAPVAAPVVGAGERSGNIDRPATTAPVAAPAEATLSGDTYQVRRGDSLSLIARRLGGAGGAQGNRTMIAIYRANPEAFEGNINLLKSGAVLRLPDSSAISAVDPGEAAREVSRQSASWSGSSTSGAAVVADPRLRLVPPTGTGGAGSTNTAEVSSLRDRVNQLETELAESRRLLELRNAELARLQSLPATAPAETDVTAPEPAPAVAAVTEPAAPAVEPPPVAETPPVATPAPATPASVGPGLVDRLKAFWFVPVGLLVLALGFLGLRAARRRRENDLDAGLGAFGTTMTARESSSNTLPLRKPVIEPGDAAFLVEESGTHQRPNFAAQSAGRKVDIDEASSTASLPQLDATAALEQGDPLAEADFHMAYGLYDQAADLVRLSIDREPQRRDLKLKLLEVFFVWGNKDQFLQTARTLAETRELAEPGEWEKVVIMGKQLAPEDALFAQATGGMGQGGIDLNLEGGQNRIDFDLHGEPVAMTSDAGVDLDLSSVLDDKDSTGNLIGLDFALDDPLRGADPGVTATTRQMIQPGFSGGGEAATLRFQGMEGSEGPTIEQPQLDAGQTMRHKLDAQMQYGAPDQTAELALDDLGLDLGRLESTGTNLLDDSRLSRVLESTDAPTLIAGLGDTSRQLIGMGDDDVTGSHLADMLKMDDSTAPGSQATELMPLGDFNTDAGQPTELLPLGQAFDSAGATSRFKGLDFELGDDNSPGDATGTQSQLVSTDFGLDLDVGAPEQPPTTEYVQTQRITPSDVAGLDPSPTQDLEPITMSEVGTKLDLARAYMDMGDPDGARSILNEVLLEGSVSQKQEAQRLIDSIPG